MQKTEGSEDPSSGQADSVERLDKNVPHSSAVQHGLEASKSWRKLDLRAVCKKMDGLLLAVRMHEKPR